LLKISKDSRPARRSNCKLKASQVVQQSKIRSQATEAGISG
jgi:hypothetical protein